MTLTVDKTRSGRVVRKVNLVEDSDSEEEVARESSYSSKTSARRGSLVVHKRDLIGDEEDEPMDMKTDSRYNSDSEELSAFEDDDDSSSETSEAFLVPVPVASATEIQHTRALVIQQRQQVAELQAKYTEQKKITDKLETALRLAERTLFATQAILAPVSRVPAEVLGLIFAAHVNENLQSPWPLMQISRAWRAAALMTRVIWGRILLAHPSWVKSKTGGARVRVYEGMEVCFKQPQLLRALKRAGATPLDLKIVFTHEITRVRYRDGRTQNQMDLLNLISTIFAQHVAARLRSLSITTDWNFTLPTETLLKFDFSSLVSLSLDKEYPEVVQKVVKESPGFRSLHIRGACLNEMEKYTRWDGLEELGITELRSVKDMQLVRRMLSAPISLVSVSLHSGFLFAPGEPPIPIPSLKRLELYRVSGYWPIDCPNLTHLTFNAPPPHDGLENGSIHLPYLVELIYISNYSMGRHLRVFSVPALHKFSFQCGDGRAACATALKTMWPFSTSKGQVNSSAISNIEPRSFHIHKTAVNQKVLAHVLTGRKRLEEIVSIDVELSAEFFNCLLPVAGKETKTVQEQKGRGKKVGWNIPCDALKRLELDVASRKKVKQDQSTVEAAARAFIEARKKAGAPLERLAMRFSKDEGWKDLVSGETDD